MSFSEHCISIFNKAINDYHIKDDTDGMMINPFDKDSVDSLFYVKSWIDVVQWHLEDMVRNPHIDPAEALAIKRKIDSSNQERTDVVEQIDRYFLHEFRNVKALPDARINTESPAWALDRLSILTLKIYHMNDQIKKCGEGNCEHKLKCTEKLNILLIQQKDLSLAIDQLLDDIKTGRKYMKVYLQMKMYNDPSMNPMLYANKKK